MRCQYSSDPGADVVPRVPFRSTCTVDGERAVIVLQGQFDAPDRSDMLQMLAAAIARVRGPVVVDLERAQFLNVEGIGLLERAEEYLRTHDRDLVYEPVLARAVGAVGAGGPVVESSR